MRRSASIWLDKYFYPRSPCGERPVTRVASTPTTVISIHALLAESDAVCNQLLFDTLISIHALLAESDLASLRPRSTATRFLSTLSLRRATPFRQCTVRPSRISIHALLAESDGRRDSHSARAIIFLSTLSLRRATRDCICIEAIKTNFYPRSPCGERHAHGNTSFIQVKFLSTLSLRRATNSQQGKNNGHEFLSTLSLRRATTT